MPRLLILVITGLVSAGLMAISVDTAHSARPAQKKPRTCKSYFHGPIGTALKKSTARKRARRKWQRRVHLKHGRKYKTWRYSADKHYDCDKKRRWHRCKAAAYPCPLREADG